MKRIAYFASLMMMAQLLHADFRIMGGINQSKYTVSPEGGETEWDYKTGFSVGIGLEKNLSDTFILECDILFFQKGSQVLTGPEESEWKYCLNTVSFPLMLRAKLFSGTSPYILGGIELSLILSHKIKSRGEEDIDWKENTKSLDYGPVFGCGLEIGLQEYLFLFIEARYQMGWRNIISLQDGIQSMKTGAVVILVGVRS